MVIITRLVMAVHLGQSVWSPLMHPVAAAFFVAVAWASYVGWRRGGVEWKGRHYGGQNNLDFSSEAVVPPSA